MDSPRFSRRRFLTVGGAALMAPGLCPAAQADGVLVQGDFRYRIVPKSERKKRRRKAKSAALPVTENAA
jgi:hypothetical protein